MDYLEIAGTAIGLIYLYLEYRANVWLWVASIAMPAVYLKVYYDAGLYADFWISIYYLAASVYGLICWLRSNHDTTDKGQKPETGIIHTPASSIAPLAGVFTILLIAIGFILSRFTDSTVPWADAFTTALSIVAMWMLAKKYVEQWLVWIAADIACSVLYLYKDLWFTSGLYLIYAVIAVFGFRKWISLIACEQNRGTQVL